MIKTWVLNRCLNRFSAGRVKHLQTVLEQVNKETQEEQQTRVNFSAAVQEGKEEKKRASAGTPPGLTECISRGF